LNDPHSGEKLDTYFGRSSIEKYVAKLKENDEKLMAHFSRYDIRSVKIFTEDEVIGKLMKLFT